MAEQDHPLYSIRFLIEGLPLTTNSARASQGHWAARYKLDKTWKKHVWHKVLQMGKPKSALNRAHVTLIRHSASQPDFEGLVSSFKTILDGLVESGVIENDNTQVIGQPTYHWQKSKPGKGFIEVIVKELLPEDTLTSFNADECIDDQMSPRTNQVTL